MRGRTVRVLETVVNAGPERFRVERAAAAAFPDGRFIGLIDRPQGVAIQAGVSAFYEIISAQHARVVACVLATGSITFVRRACQATISGPTYCRCGAEPIETPVGRCVSCAEEDETMLRQVHRCWDAAAGDADPQAKFAVDFARVCKSREWDSRRVNEMFARMIALGRVAPPGASS